MSKKKIKMNPKNSLKITTKEKTTLMKSIQKYKIKEKISKHQNLIARKFKLIEHLK